MRRRRCARLVVVLVLLFAAAGGVVPAAATIGREIADPDTDALPVTVYANGDGLPAGQGSVQAGADLYAEQCARCHGGRGEGGSAIELVGDRSLLATEYPDRGIAVFWPYAPPLYDYVRRAMPPDAPLSLDTDETYAVIAYLLHLNALLDADAVLDAARLASIVMPNRDGFEPGHSRLGLEE